MVEIAVILLTEAVSLDSLGHVTSPHLSLYWLVTLPQPHTAYTAALALEAAPTELGSLRADLWSRRLGTGLCGLQHFSVF